MDDFVNLEKTWDQLLSREPQTIKNCFARLDKDSQQTVIAHLQEMVIRNRLAPGAGQISVCCPQSHPGIGDYGTE